MPAQAFVSLPRSFLAAVSSVWILAASAQAEVKLDVPYVPTPPEVVNRMLELTQVTEKDYVIDLGCGDGRTPVMAASKYKARKALGVDIDPERIAEANANARKAGVTDRVTFRQEDLFKTPIREASVLTMYLLSSVNLKLRPRILKEMRPGSRVVSHSFDMGDWEADIHDTQTGHFVYVWVVPANVEGRWRITQGGRTINLNLTQKYQKVSGTARVGGRQVALENVNLSGAELSFVLDTGKGRRLFVGQVDGRTIREAKEITGPAKVSSLPRADRWSGRRG